MERLEGKRILITGPAGQIAFPLAAQLAKHNEVWGIARFSEPGSRERVEAAGIRAQQVDLVAPDWSKLPEDFDYLLHLAAFIGPGHDYDRAWFWSGLGLSIWWIFATEDLIKNDGMT